MEEFNPHPLYQNERGDDDQHSDHIIHESSRNCHKFYNSLAMDAKRDRWGQLTRYDIVPTKSSAWRHLYNGGSNYALIALTGFNHKCSEYVLTQFAPSFDNYSPFNAEFIHKVDCNQGRPRKIRPEDCLVDMDKD